jgi:transcriptional regulator with XRE-family HTH domain
MAEDIKKEIQEENLVKKTCRELGITQKELAEKLGVNDGTVRNWASSGNIPIYMINHINLLINYNYEVQFKIKFKELIRSI